MPKYKIIMLIASLVLLSILVFYIGDQISFGNTTPLETIFSQFICVVCLWGIFGLVWLWKKYQLKKSEEKLVNQLVITEDVISNEEQQIKEKFIQALKALKANNKFSINGGGLYQKPWYMLIGAPGTGKTTTLVNSMLHFADSHELSKQAIQGVGGTRLCDWWFTDEATLIDTAGRFTIQENDISRDKAAWQIFVQSLKKNRPLQPINGVIVFLSVTDLVSEEERIRAIKNIKLRLKELHHFLAIKIPVYIIINKMDLLLGFNEFFSSLNKDARNQVFGVTFPYGRPINNNINLLKEGLDDIYKNLTNNRIDLLEREANLINKSKILLFPERYNLLMPLISKIFVEFSLEEDLLNASDIRGFYFTSATQLGNPIDNILNNVGIFSADNKSQINQSIGKAFFINDLLKKTIFIEAGLVIKKGFFDAKKIWYISYLIIPLVFFVLSGIWSLSYIKTKSLTSQIDADYQRIALLKKKVDYANILSLSDYLQELNDFKIKTESYYKGLPLNGLGLNTLSTYNKQVDYAYTQSLKIALAQLLYREIESKLNQNKNNYLLLKAYLLLADEKKHEVNTRYLAKILVDDVVAEKLILGERQRLSLIVNIDELLQERPLVLANQLNQSLINKVRDNIKENGFSDVVYGILQESLDKDIKDWSLLKIMNNTNIFYVSDEKKTDIIIPAFFTREAFYKIKNGYLEQALESLEDDSDWVLGIDFKKNNTNKKDLKLLVIAKYLKNYHQKWSNLLSSLSLVHGDSVNENLEIIKSLAIEQGALKNFIDNIVWQTILTQDVVDNNSINIISKISSKILEDNILKLAKEVVDDDFSLLANLMYSPDLKKDAESFSALIKEIEGQLYLLQETSKRGQTLPDVTPLQVKIMTMSNTMPSPLSNILKGLYINIGKLSQGAATKEMQNQLKELSGICQKLIKNKYPFSKKSAEDISFIDMGKLFSNQGVFLTFLNENLHTLIDKSESAWKAMNTAQGVKINQNVVANFQRVDAIRRGFFQNNMSLPYFSFTLHWLEVPPEMLMQQASISIDGQQFIIQANNNQVFNWPALPGGNNVVINISNNNLSGYKFEGPWAILRFIDKGNPIYENNGQKVKLKWSTGVGVLSAEILSTNPENPFIPSDIERFNCGME